MRKRTVAACVSAIGAAGAVAVGTTVAASAAPQAQTQYIRFLSTDVTGNGPTYVIANGPIHARGTDKQLNAHKDLLVFRGGGVVVRHKAVSRHHSYDPRTCYGRQTESGTYTVIGGDGKYANASGHGVYRLVVQFIGCNMNNTKLFMLQIQAHGPMSI